MLSARTHARTGDRRLVRPHRADRRPRQRHGLAAIDQTDGDEVAIKLLREEQRRPP
jgi:hypothetical protein